MSELVILDKPQKDTVTDVAWWHPRHKEDRAAKITVVAGQIFKSLITVRADMFRYGGLYEELPFTGSSPRAFRRRRVLTAAPILSLNICKAVTDTYISLVTKDLPKTTFLTSGADPEVQRKASVMQEFVDGVRETAGVLNLYTELNFDTGKFGTGVIKICEGGSKKKPTITCDRVMPWDFLVGEQDGQHRKPRSVFQVHRMDRSKAQALWPDKAEELTTANTVQLDDGDAYNIDDQVVFDMITMVEAWHMPLYEGGPGGIHALVCGDVVVFEEPYLHEHPPFVLLYRQLPTMGVYGTSLCKELAGIQKAINRLLRDATRAEAMCPGHWLVEQNSNVNTASLNDQLGIIRYSGTPPQYEAPVAVSPSLYGQLDRLWQRGFEVIGVSQMAAQSQKPAGLDSGEAIRAYADVTTLRFLPCYRLFQDFAKQVDEQILTVARDIAKKHPNFEVRAMGRASAAIIKASEALLEENEFTLRLAETNAMADDPPAKLAQIQEMMAANLLRPMTGRRLLTDIPDLKEQMSLENASYEAIVRRMEDIIKHGKYRGPEPLMQLGDLPTGDPGAVTIATEFMLKAENDGEPEETLSMLLRWIAEAQDLLTPPAPPPPPPGAPLAPLGPGQPGPPLQPGSPGLPIPPPGMNGGSPVAAQPPPMPGAA